jgi:hypothetical protein
MEHTHPEWRKKHRTVVKSHRRKNSSVRRHKRRYR